MARAERIHLNIPSQLLEAVNRICRETGLPRSELIRRALEAHMLAIADRAKTACAGREVSTKTAPAAPLS